MNHSDRQLFHGQVDIVTQNEKLAFLTGATQLTVRQRFVRVTANTTFPSWTLTLPSVVEAVGLIFSIRATIADVQAVTVADAGDDPDFVNLTLDTDGDGALLYSDGEKWWTLASDIA